MEGPEGLRLGLVGRNTQTFRCRNAMGVAPSASGSILMAASKVRPYATE